MTIVKLNIKGIKPLFVLYVPSTESFDKCLQNIYMQDIIVHDVLCHIWKK